VKHCEAPDCLVTMRGNAVDKVRWSSAMNTGAVAEDNRSEEDRTGTCLGKQCTPSAKSAVGTEQQSWGSRVEDVAQAQAAATTLSRMLRGMFARKHMRTIVEYQRIQTKFRFYDHRCLGRPAKISSQEDQPAARQPLLKVDTVLDAARARKRSRKGYERLRRLMMYTAVMLVAMFSFNGSFKNSHETQQVLLDTLVYNTTKTNDISWVGIKSLWDFYDWHDNLLIPATFSDDIYIRYQDPATKQITNMPPPKLIAMLNAGNVTSYTDFKLMGQKRIGERLRPVHSLIWNIEASTHQECDTGMYHMYHTNPGVNSSEDCFDTTNKTETELFYYVASKWKYIMGQPRNELFAIIDEDFQGSFRMSTIVWNPNTNLLGEISLKMDVSESGVWEPSLYTLFATSPEKDYAYYYYIWIFTFGMLGVATVISIGVLIYRLWTDFHSLFNGFFVMRMIGESLAVAYIVTVVIYMTDIYPSMDMHSTEFFLYEHFAHKHYAEVTADVESVQACAAYQQRFQVPYFMHCRLLVWVTTRTHYW